MSTFIPRAALPLLLALVASLLTPAPGSAVPTDPFNVSVMGRHWLSPHVTVTWDGDAEDVSYDVRVSRTDSRRERRGRMIRPSALQGVTATRHRVPVRSGHTICVSVRANLEGGGTSAWTTPTCWTRAYGVGRLVERGDVRTVRSERMWGGRGLVTEGRGRVVLRRVPRGLHVGFVVTNPADDGPQRGYRFRSCNNQEIVDVTSPGDPLDYNQVVELGVPTRREPCRIVFHRLQHTASSFPLQGVRVLPDWA